MQTGVVEYASLVEREGAAFARTQYQGKRRLTGESSESYAAFLLASSVSGWLPRVDAAALFMFAAVGELVNDDAVPAIAGLAGKLAICGPIKNLPVRLLNVMPKP